jgi:hypothetical protein
MIFHSQETKRYYLIAGISLVFIAILAYVVLSRCNSLSKPPLTDLPTEPDMVACTMEAKICPDGSAVGRQGPNCEFSPCPTVATSTLPLDLAAQIQACLPLSNWQAKQTCDRLLALINNFDDCSQAGFLVQESYPARCSTPDGRSFVQDISPSPAWEELRQAVLDCRVKSVMQSHDRRVEAVLRNGEVLEAVEPQIDDIMDIAGQAQEQCFFEIIMATE